MSRKADGTLLLRIRLSPGAARAAIGGIHLAGDGCHWLKASVRSAPDKGKANAELLRMVAGTCGCPVSAVSLVSGTASRLKRVAIAGADGEVEARLAGMLRSG